MARATVQWDHALVGPRSGGTTRFMAPGLLRGERVQISFGADIYAFACMCIEVCPRCINDSLHNLAVHLSQLGEHKEAVVYNRQAVDVRWGLAQKKLEEFNPLLAKSLYGLAIYLSQLGEYKEAVVCGVQAADIRRDLARQNPNEFNQKLADSPHNLTCYSEQLRQHKEVVKFGREAAVLFRSIVLDRPEERRWFVKCLKKLATSLDILGFVDEAREADEEAEREEKLDP